LIGAAVLILVAFFALVSSADAAHYQRPFKEAFGSAAQPSFEWSQTVAVDKQTGDVLVADYYGQDISRFHADGTPAPFTALGTNVIDGKEANGKPCAEEPASCDKTPQNEIEIRGVEDTEIAIDESGGATNGDIYLSQPNNELVDIFAPDGKYLGQLTEYVSPLNGLVPFHTSASGVAVDAAGAVYVSVGQEIHKYVPSANPVVATDNVGNFELPVYNIWTIAAGSGPSAGLLFALTSSNGVYRAYDLDTDTGEVKYGFGLEQAGIGAIAVDPNSGTVLLPAKEHSAEVLEFEAPAGSEPVRISRLLAKSRADGFAVNGSSEVLLGEGYGEPHLRIYGTPGLVPTVTAEPATEVIGTKASLSGTVNPGGLPVTECVFEYGKTTGYGKTVPCEGTIGEDSTAHPVHAELTGLEPNGQTYHFKLLATNANGTEESADQTLTTADTTVTEAATAVGSATVTLNGTVRPEGEAYSECFFEYGLSSSPNFEKTAPCNPSAKAITPDFFPHAVKAVLSNLEEGSTYRFRLVAKNGFGVIKGDQLTVTTHGAPRINDVNALDADQNSVSLEGKINPMGFGTSYRFEWGPTASYGHIVPVEFEPFVGSGEVPVRVSVKVSGLSAGTTYHYRIVARSEQGIIASPDQIFETLNSCGLAEGRCYELVSRRDAGPVAIPGEEIASAEMHYQAATSGPGLAYPVEAGYPDSTKGAEVLYRAFRGPNEWESVQLSASISETNEQEGVTSGNGPFEFLSNDLSCGFLQSNQLLTSDPGTRLLRESGGSNVYRLNPDGSHTAVTALAPENPRAPEGAGYSVAGASQDCGKVVFQSGYQYPGVPGAAGPANQRLYEWDEGTLRTVGWIPGPGGEEVPVVAEPGTGTGRIADTQNLVSEDGSRVFFTALRQTSPNPEEIYQEGIFVRENGTTTRDLSESETSTPDRGATYQWATPDGSRVYFLANSGLTANSSPAGGTDLYEYNLETEELTDVSAWTDPEDPKVGAEAAGFVAASPDGSYVYFAARGQLAPGRGNTNAQNKAEKTYSIFGEHDGEYSYVGKFTEQSLERVVVARQGEWSSQVTPDGRYLLFESPSNVTGYDSGGAEEAYLYDSEGGSEGTICISCRQDGQPSVAPLGPPLYNVLPTDEAINNPLHPPHYLAEREGRPLVFFTSPDGLAPGAVEHQNNIYEWSHGQIFRLTSAEEGQQSPSPFGGYFAALGGVSDNGSDVYFVTPETINWEDGDQRLSAYDARIGGGYPQPSAPPAPCNPNAEDSCQGPSQQGSSVPGPVTPNVTGEENVAPEKSGNKKQQPKKKSKKGKHKKKNGKRKGKSKSKRKANGNRRAGK
jgi:hypothetical protein